MNAADQLASLSWLRDLPGRPLVVAEIKQKSPYGWSNPMPWREQLTICEAVGDIISVHTDPFWGGSWAHLYAVRRATAKPILAKGFHPSVAHVEAALDILNPTDWVLTVGWDGGDYWERCWFETETLEQLGDQHPDQRCVWNARDPRTGKVRPEAPWEVMAANERRHCLPTQGHPWLCQASLIRGARNVIPRTSAVLIGQGLYEDAPTP